MKAWYSYKTFFYYISYCRIHLGNLIAEHSPSFIVKIVIESPLLLGIYWLICIVYIIVESALRLYISFANNTRSIANAQPAGVEWYLLSYVSLACMIFASIIYTYESAEYIFTNTALNDKRYSMLILKNTCIIIAEIIIIIAPFVVSRI